MDEVLKEKQRRTMGKETTTLREQMEKEARQREFAAAKREKEAQKRERERLKAEIEKDKAERRARGGTLNSVSIGVEKSSFSLILTITFFCSFSNT